MTKNKLIKIMIFSFILPLQFSFAKKKEQIIATVDGIKISKKLFEETYKQNLLFVSDKIVTKEKVLNDLINRRLGIKKAKKNKLASNPIVKSIGR